MRMSQTVLLVVLFILLGLTVSACLCIIPQQRRHTGTERFTMHQLQAAPTCGVHTCGALDPVSDPAYNMQQIAKQSILLEEHIAEHAKRCKDCIIKHFLHIIGLAEEAVWLAVRDFREYPYLEDAPTFYNQQMERWLVHQEDEAVLSEILSELRTMRKSIIQVYYIQASSSKQQQPAPHAHHAQQQQH